MIPFFEKSPSDLQLYPLENRSFSHHLHSSIELLFITEGCACIEINNQIYHVHAGECIIVFPEQVHSYLKTEGYKSRLLIVTQNVVGRYKRYFQQYTPENPVLTSGQLTPDFFLALRRLEETIATDSLLAEAWLQVLLANIFPHFLLKKKNVSEEPDLALRIVQYVTEHFQEPLTLDFLAKELHVNKYYLSHTISNRLHVNFRDYLNEIRLDYAIQLISSDQTLTQIWSDAGFESQTNFNRIFRLKKGMTPSQYRNSIIKPRGSSC